MRKQRLQLLPTIPPARDDPRDAAQQALRRTVMCYRRLLEAIDEGIWVVDAGGRTEYINERMARMVGASAEAMLGRPAFDFLDAAAQAEVRERLERRRCGVREGGEIHLRRPDGSELWALTNSCPLTADDGSFAGALVTASDITERKRGEEADRFLADAGRVLASSLELEDTLRSLAELVVPRLADWCVIDVLDDNALPQALEVRAAHAADEALVRRMLAHSPAHQQPHEYPIGYVLHTGEGCLISAMSEAVLQASAQDEEHLRLLRELQPRSSIIVPLLARERVLGAVTLATGRSGRDYGPRDYALAQELARRAATAVDNARLYRRAQEASRAHAELRRAIAHDLRSPLGVVTLYASLLRESAAGQAEADEPLRAILQAAEQMDRRIQDLLEVHRQEGGGAAPAAAPPPAPRPAAAEPAAAEGAGAAAAPPPRPRVLLVDDHPAVLHGLQRLLERDGRYDVVATAATGEEAILKARGLIPELVVMDITLPGMSGIEAARAIVALGRDIRVIALTANAEEETLLPVLQAGGSGFVHKRMAHQQLIPALDTVMQGGVFLNPSGNRLLLHGLQTRQAAGPLASLSEHERQVLTLSAEGHTSKEIGKRLFLSPRTVDNYRMQAMHKLGLRHRAEVVHFLVRAGVLQAD